MMRFGRCVLALALLVLSPWLAAASLQPGPSDRPGQSAQAQLPAARVALLVGNADYAQVPLRNPPNDVRQVGAALRDLGFEVTIRENLDGRALRDAMRRFALAHRTAQVRVFYFAGHGFQMRGRNYLVPVGARIANESDVLDKTADVTELVEQLGAIGAGANIVIVDACRVPPMLASGTRQMWGVRAGLSRIEPPSGTLVAYSTRPGQVARDGDGRLSVYARHLTDALHDAPGLQIELFFKRVRDAVARETERQQVPWESSDLTGDLCFSQPAGKRCVGP